MNLRNRIAEQVTSCPVAEFTKLDKAVYGPLQFRRWYLSSTEQTQEIVDKQDAEINEFLAYSNIYILGSTVNPISNGSYFTVSYRKILNIDDVVYKPIHTTQGEPTYATIRP